MPLNHMLKKYYAQSSDQDDLISIGTIGLIKGISSFDPSKGARLATYAARCIENEILMYFRSQKKLQGEVSLSETIESDREGNALQLMDVIGVDDTMLEDLYDRDSALRLRRLVKECLTQRESEVIRLRYGLGGTVPLTNGRSPPHSAFPGAMYRVLRSGHWKSCGQNWKSLWAAEPVNSRTAGQFRRLIRKNRGLPAVRPKSLRIFYTYFPIFNL